MPAPFLKANENPKWAHFAINNRGEDIASRDGRTLSQVIKKRRCSTNHGPFDYVIHFVEKFLKLIEDGLQTVGPEAMEKRAVKYLARNLTAERLQQIQRRDDTSREQLQTTDCKAPEHVGVDEVVARTAKTKLEGEVRVGFSLEGDKEQIVKIDSISGAKDRDKELDVKPSYMSFFAQPPRKGIANDDDNHLIDASLAMLEDYYAPKSGQLCSCIQWGWGQRFITGHWNRHHVDDAKDVVAFINSLREKNESSKGILRALCRELESEKNKVHKNPEQSSYLRRIEFIMHQLEQNEAIQSPDIIASEASIMH